MENTNTTSAAASSIECFDRVDVPLKKAKAITRLMAYAVAEGSTDHSEEIIWAHQVVDSLIDEALESAEILAAMSKGSGDDAPSPDPA